MFGNNTNPILTRLPVLIAMLASLPLALMAGNAVGNQNYRFLFMLICGGALMIMLFATKDYFWVITLASVYLAGSFMFLGGFNLFQIFTIIGVAKFVIENLVIRKLSIARGPSLDFKLIMGFMAIFAYHATKDRLGLRVLGSDVWGGRHYIGIFLACAAYFVIQTLPINQKAWSRLPFFILVIIAFDFGLALITAAVPSLVDRIWPFYSGVSLAGYENADMGVSADVTERVGAWGTFGFGLLALTLARYNIASLWQPKYWVGGIAFCCGLVGCFMSGFRSAILNAVLIILAASWRDTKKGIFVVIALGGVVLGLLPVLNDAYPLPKQVQRGLVFLPGNWDRNMVLDAEASNGFRYTVWELWYTELFYVHPFVGRGFGFDPTWAQAGGGGTETDRDLATIQTGNFHNGLISCVDSLGLIGAAFFVTWAIIVFFRVCRYLFSVKDRSDNPALRWISLVIFVYMLTFWYGATGIGGILPRLFLLTAVLNILLKDRESQSRLKKEQNLLSKNPAQPAKNANAVYPV